MVFGALVAAPQAPQTWIVVQLLVMQRYFFLQPVIAALGIAELALARVWQQAGSAGRAPRQHRPVLHG
jgi:hypothetical protein